MYLSIYIFIYLHLYNHDLAVALILPLCGSLPTPGSDMCENALAAFFASYVGTQMH